MRAIVTLIMGGLIVALGAHAGNIDTVAGGGASYGDEGPATSALLGAPTGVAVDAAGNLYIADASFFVVRRVDAVAGIITTAAGNGTYGQNGEGDGGPATDANLSTPFGVAVDLSGNLYIADYVSSRVRYVDMATGIITTLAGNGSISFTGDGGLATAAALALPEGVAVDGAGDVYIADTQNYRVRKVTRATGVISTIAGVGLGDGSGASGDGGLAINAQLGAARRVAVDVQGNLYIVDANAVTGLIRRVDGVTNIISTVAGGGTSPGESGLALDADLGEVRDVAPDDAGNIYIAGRFRVWKVDAAGAISVFAGTGVTGFGGDSGPAALAVFGELMGVALGGDGGVYISDQGNVRIRRVEPEECADGLDNDGDTWLDYPSDPGCTSANDSSERALGSLLLPCDNGANDDTDSFTDFPDDPGCQNAASVKENPRCQNGADDDGQLGTDFDGGDSVLGIGNGDPNGPDPQCDQPWKNREAVPPPPGGSCGIGIELALLLPLLARARRLRRAPQRRAGS